jgi:hypothetical protein
MFYMVSSTLLQKSFSTSAKADRMKIAQRFSAGVDVRF